MAYFAKLDGNNMVLDVNVVDNQDVQNLPFPESEAVGVEFLKQWSGGYTNWKQTSYNSNFRKNYAGIGFTYNVLRDAFIPPKPHLSWVLVEETCLWAPPVPRPNINGTESYIWDEATISWKLTE